MKKNILVAPLNWGLGHATRCIPIIHHLIKHGFNPIVASDGLALEILRKEFPDVLMLTLPSYQIEYAKNGKNFKWKLIKNSPKMISAILEEKKIVKKWVQLYQLSGIISDNRLGVRNKNVPSVFITHQLNVLTGNTTKITTKLHLNIIKKFDACWVPDFKEKPNLTGKLGHLAKTPTNVNYIGPLSRLSFQNSDKKYDLMILLSGPEPQRSMLEEILRTEALKYPGNVLFVKGSVESDQEQSTLKNITFYNFMNASQLEMAVNESEMVLCRSGYTTIMDLAKLGKKAYFIPTPGQYEQEYLAKRLQKQGFYPYCDQNDFKIENLADIDNYTAIRTIELDLDWKKLFSVFTAHPELSMPL